MKAGTKRGMHPGRVVRSMVTVAITATGVALGTGTALAEEGSFRGLKIQVQDYTMIDHAEGQIAAGSLTGTLTILESSGAPFMEGAHSINRCLVLARTSSAGLDLNAPCTMTDSDGDHLYMEALRRSGDIEAGGGGDGRFTLQGGTGKYAGLSGDCPYETEYLAGERVVTEMNCTWRRAAE